MRLRDGMDAGTAGLRHHATSQNFTVVQGFGPTDVDADGHNSYVNGPTDSLIIKNACLAAPADALAGIFCTHAAVAGNVVLAFIRHQLGFAIRLDCAANRRVSPTPGDGGQQGARHARAYRADHSPLRGHVSLI